MHKTGWGVVALVCAGSVASADVYRSNVRGTGAVATVHDVSADGCVVTDGQFAAVSSSDLGPYAIAIVTQWNSCTDSGRFYAGGGTVDVAANGLSSMNVSGAFELVEYTGNGYPSLTLEANLAFNGTGTVSAQASHYTSGSAGGTTLFFDSSKTRAATASGTLTLDGDAASLADVLLASNIAGELSVVH